MRSIGAWEKHKVGSNLRAKVKREGLSLYNSCYKRFKDIFNLVLSKCLLKFGMVVAFPVNLWNFRCGVFSKKRMCIFLLNFIWNLHAKTPPKIYLKIFRGVLVKISVRCFLKIYLRKIHEIKFTRTFLKSPGRDGWKYSYTFWFCFKIKI